MSYKRYSIRWQLPITYAVIAFFVAVALGFVLIIVLRSYYSEQERQYLVNNAHSIGRLVERWEAEAMSSEEITARLTGLSALVDTRIQYVDAEGTVVTDSASVPRFVVSVSPQDSLRAERLPDPPDILVYEGTVVEDGAVTFEFFRNAGAMPRPREQAIINLRTDSAPLPQDVAVGDTMIAVGRSFYGFNFVTDGEPLDRSHRSVEVADVTLTLPTSGAVIGSIILREGPAYGREIVDNVIVGWLFASAVAIVLAVLVGWFISRRLTDPLLLLHKATVQMSEGALSTRAHIQRRDELGELARAFNTMAGRIEETVDTLKRFVADAAHELHTPLTALRTNLELVDEHAQTASSQRALQQIERLKVLADDLLDLSRLEAKSEVQVKAPVDLVALLHDVSAVYASRADQADLDYILHVPEQAVWVCGSRSQLERMVSNLLDNAIKFTPPAGVVQVTLLQVGGMVELVVQDTGIGIPQEEIALLFGRFRRGRNAAQYPGSGLGLAIVKAIIDLHGGTIHVESEPNGTRLISRLPTMTVMPVIAGMQSVVTTS
ncbi:MAG: hypothetical protein OHK0046_39520 [Anaerolineae bacterium]